VNTEQAHLDPRNDVAVLSIRPMAYQPAGPMNGEGALILCAVCPAGPCIPPLLIGYIQLREPSLLGCTVNSVNVTAGTRRRLQNAALWGSSGP